MIAAEFIFSRPSKKLTNFFYMQTSVLLVSGWDFISLYCMRPIYRLIHGWTYFRPFITPHYWPFLLSFSSFFFCILFNVSVFVIKDIFLKSFLQLFPAVFRPYYSFVLRATEVDNASVTKCNIRPFVSTMFCGP